MVRSEADLSIQNFGSVYEKMDKRCGWNADAAFALGIESLQDARRNSFN